MPIANLGAMNTDSNTYVFPINAKKGDKYKCPDCSKELVFCKGPKLPPYFRHKASNTPCNYYTHPSESQIHKDAKLCIQALLLKGDIKFIRKCSKCSKSIDCCISKGDRDVVLEHRFMHNGSLKIADCALVSIDADDNPITCIEVYHTHKTLSSDRPEPWFEIDAAKTLQLSNTPAFDNRLVCLRSDYICTDCLDIMGQQITLSSIVVESINLKDNSIVCHIEATTEIELINSILEKHHYKSISNTIKLYGRNKFHPVCECESTYSLSDDTECVFVIGASHGGGSLEYAYVSIMPINDNECIFYMDGGHYYVN